jgi:hypothetical protein
LQHLAPDLFLQLQQIASLDILFSLQQIADSIIRKHNLLLQKQYVDAHPNAANDLQQAPHY